jgi:hypothetical protein
MAEWSPTALMSLAALVANAALGTYVLWRNPRGRSAQTYALLMVSFVIWDLSETGIRLLPLGAQDPSIMPWLRMEWVGIALIAGALPHFVFSYAGRGDLLRQRWVYALLYGPVLAMVAIIWTTDLLVAGAVEGPLGPSATLGPLYPLAAVVYTAWIFFALLYLLTVYRGTETDIVRRRSLFLLAGLSVPVVIGTITEVYWPLIPGNVTRLGMGTIYTLIMGACTAYAIARYQLLVIDPVVETKEPSGVRLRLEEGRNHLVLERGSEGSYSAFRDMVTHTPGLCLTTRYPGKLARRYGLERTPMVWLTSLRAGEMALKPTDLEYEVYQTVARFVKENRRTAILVDDLEYLSRVNGFPQSADFLKRLSDIVAGSGSTLLASLDPQAFTEAQMATIQQNFDHDTTFIVPSLKGVESLPQVVPGESVLILSDTDTVYRMLYHLPMGDRVLSITGTFPGKVEEKHGLTDVDFLWISDVGAAGYESVPPRELDLKGAAAVMAFLEKGPGTILVEGLEHLLSVRGFIPTLEFVKKVSDAVARAGGVLVVGLDPRAMDPAELAVFRKRFDHVAE